MGKQKRREISKSPEGKHSEHNQKKRRNDRDVRWNEHRYNKSRSSPPNIRRSRSPQSRDKRSNKTNDESERAKKLKEMMDNANWREEQRLEKVTKHRQNEREETSS